MNFSCIFPLVYEFGRGVRIFENIAGVRIRTLVYEKKNSGGAGGGVGRIFYVAYFPF